jgi:adenine-specific DNA-methyltransferase
MKNKNTGAYYTPSYLASFLTNRVFENVGDIDVLSLLEPSVGDGSFIDEIRRYLCNYEINLTALDIDADELEKASSKWIDGTNFIKQDFLEFETDDKFSVIIGNPPYIKKNRLNASQIEKIKQIHFDAGLSEKTVKNIWTTFLIKSCSLLNDDGILAFILPSELLQVKFAEEIRDYLQNIFQRIEIFTFNDLMFECKGQDTVVLMCYKISENQGVYYTNIAEANQLFRNDFQLNRNDTLLQSSLKWTNHFLTSDEVNFLENLKNKLNVVNYYCDSKPGIVTAANSFFIINEQTKEKYKLDDYTRPIIQKGLFVNGSVVFRDTDYQRLLNSNQPSLLLKFDESDLLSSEIVDYLSIGVDDKLPDRYKCKLRNKWYVIPNVSYQSEGFFFKRSHLYPKILKNEANVYVTDSAYKIQMKDGYNISSLIYSFYNSLTLVYSEIEGRYYGGGVLELTPSEFKKLPIPYVNISEKKFEEYAMKFENKKNIQSILLKNDYTILNGVLGLTSDEITQIQNIHKKLLAKRLRK